MESMFNDRGRWRVGGAVLCAAALALALGACSGADATPTTRPAATATGLPVQPTATRPAVQPTATASAQQPTPIATIPPQGSPTPPTGGSPVPTVAPLSTPSPVPAPLFLTIVAPEDESTLDTRIVTISGKTLPEAVVSINGDVAEIDASGSFAVQVTLEEGPNTFEVIATDDSGAEVTSDLTVSYAP